MGAGSSTKRNRQNGHQGGNHNSRGRSGGGGQVNNPNQMQAAAGRGGFNNNQQNVGYNRGQTGFNPAAGGMGNGNGSYASTRKLASNTITNDVGMKKASLKLVRNKENSNHYFIEFDFFAMVDVAINIYVCAQEIVDQNYMITTCFAVNTDRYPPPQTFRFPKGLDQSFPSNTAVIQTELYADTQLQEWNQQFNAYPVIIHMVAIYPPGHQGDKDDYSNTTFAVLKRDSPDEDYSIKILQRKLQLMGKAYLMDEIYGIEENQGVADPDNIGSECVICMTDPINTTVLPCRHMCLCRSCASSMTNKSNKCPVCRTKIEKFLHINFQQQSQAGSGGGGQAIQDGKRVEQTGWYLGDSNASS